MYCCCRLYPGTCRRNNQSPWTSGVRGAAIIESSTRGDRKGEEDGWRREREKRKKQDCGGTKTDGRHSNWKGAKTQTEVGTQRKVPGAIGNTGCGAGGAQRKFQPRFRRSVAYSGASRNQYRETRVVGWRNGGEVRGGVRRKDREERDGSRKTAKRGSEKRNKDKVKETKGNKKVERIPTKSGGNPKETESTKGSESERGRQEAKDRKEGQLQRADIKR
ncbi:hypothetical protein NDU88_001383 [Pleurodeles waltl]|uniref:Uncharacterized protein n=1 Tax=Pleurodeles waltl TaxID=8319 RepID=A0AAV7RAP2_PLEWA|nr:hypothetical protein NDU88_001383 [Pleurodeles waltl]